MKIAYKCPACMTDPAEVEAPTMHDAHMVVYLDHKGNNEKLRRDCGAASRIEYNPVSNIPTA